MPGHIRHWFTSSTGMGCCSCLGSGNVAWIALEPPCAVTCVERTFAMLRYSLPLLKDVAADMSAHAPYNSDFALRLETVTELSDVQALAGPWNALFDRCSDRASVFQSHQWVFAVLEAEQLSLEPRILLAWDGDELVGVAPFVVAQRFGARTLRWVGGTRAVYGDVLTAPGYDAKVWLRRAFADLTSKNEVHTALFENVREDAVVYPFLQDVARDYGEVSAPYLDLSSHQDFTSWKKSLSKSTRKGRNRRLRDLEGVGQVGFEFATGSSAHRDRVRELFSMKKTWAENNSVISRTIGDENFEALVERLVCAANGEPCRVSTLFLDDRPIAIEIGFVVGPRYMSYLGAYDPEFSDFSPGALQLERTVEACFQEGLETFDLLPPGDDYKRSWSTASVRVANFTLPLTHVGLIQEGLVCADIRGRIKSTLNAVPEQHRQVLIPLLRLYR